MSPVITLCLLREQHFLIFGPQCKGLALEDKRARLGVFAPDHALLNWWGPRGQLSLILQFSVHGFNYTIAGFCPSEPCFVVILPGLHTNK